MSRPRGILPQKPTRVVVPLVVPRPEPEQFDAEAIAGLRAFCERAAGGTIQMHPSTLLAIIAYVETLQGELDRLRHG